MWKKVEDLEDNETMEIHCDGTLYFKKEKNELFIGAKKGTAHVIKRSKPKYKHDCDQCKFLYSDDEGDVYYCGQNGMPTLIKRFADGGGAVLLVSSEYTELINLAHKIIVIKRGEIIKEVINENLKEQDLIEYASGII